MAFEFPIGLSLCKVNNIFFFTEPFLNCHLKLCSPSFEFQHGLCRQIMVITLDLVIVFEHV